MTGTGKKASYGVSPGHLHLILVVKSSDEQNTGCLSSIFQFQNLISLKLDIFAATARVHFIDSQSYPFSQEKKVNFQKHSV